jgi:hypothetical protein
MNHGFGKTAALLGGALLLAACGGDDEEKPTEPTIAQPTAQAVQLTGLLIQSFQTAFFASLAQVDTTQAVVLPGQAGTVEIKGNTWELKDFSPEGTLFLKGKLTVGKEQFPNIPVKGKLSFSGSQQGTLELDMVVMVQGTELTATGTIQIDDQVFDVAQLVAAAQAAQAGGG